ncbi:hypothetical protein DXA70_06310 [Faecalibacterium sp. OF04-11AC]|nr:hypothetical protein DXA70_06310 [Faecalibacterium sp. OF04-11AC]
MIDALPIFGGNGLSPYTAACRALVPGGAVLAIMRKIEVPASRTVRVGVGLGIKGVFQLPVVGGNVIKLGRLLKGRNG